MTHLSALNPQEVAEKKRRQKDRLRAMVAFMVLIAGVMYGLTLTHF
ncbi:hypothetical protein [Acetobacter orleanensis]|uniref:Uncharacterized protein n=1 Tax=Acetobacter orleanensis TaxID=104099 RepID=A0A4Y3TKZ9_9PROT|nr:hypothetical protein [Acetobacter orleanensis]GAN69390.1 hypothetical protein Abol_034_017 [Acetobacter orleanensis JCM 7639]GBR22365.1 hypothetical protein AA0473_0104 [Acetobacter orleanensis NRIC 0473]GEB83006.1 hypothetical protein AOR01nite_14830 [Acetobacter orleanensis]